jgi:hypothetical protein
MVQKIIMYLGSMDHSPSEQLGSDPSQWHTTVLVISEGGEQFGFAQAVARALGSVNGKLRKWSANPQYRKKQTFENAVVKAIRDYPVFIRAISAEAGTIKRCHPHFVSELGLRGLVRTLSKNGKPYLQFGPFTRVRHAADQQGQVQQLLEPAVFDIAERQALPLLFICHFVLKTHRLLMDAIVKTRPSIERIDWQLMPNRFPGDHGGPMGSFFHTIMSGAAHHRLVAGNIRIMTFNRSDDDEGSSLADNIAGDLTERLSKGCTSTTLVNCGEAFGWEILAPNSTPSLQKFLLSATSRS